MPIWLTHVLVPAGISVATTLVTGLAGTRLAARNKRIQDAHDDRDRFNDSVMDILAWCGNLQANPIPADVEETARAKLQAERDRWVGQIDETTIWLIDHWRRFALGYLGAMGTRDLVVRYVASARGLWLSDRPLEERVRMLQELTEPVQTIYFAHRWRMATKLLKERDRLNELLDKLDHDAPTSEAMVN
jgi:hypothetical protein